MKNKKISCFGEVLWDLLPTGRIAGGAPMNVAVHIQQMGLEASMISAIGNDELGQEIKDFLENRHVSTENIQTNTTYQTGIVEVSLDEKGSPSYKIVSPVAWDFIAITTLAQQNIRESDALVFGSLALRNEYSRNTLLNLQQYAKLKILDINLRKPYFNQELVLQLFEIADIVKVNDEELTLICSWFNQNNDNQNNAMFIKKYFNLKGILVTRGGNGAFFIDENNEMKEHGGFTVTVNDTIGSGDSFLASFLSKWLNNEPIGKCLEFACAVGAYVATQKGATPLIDKKEIEKMIG